MREGCAGLNCCIKRCDSVHYACYLFVSVSVERALAIMDWDGGRPVLLYNLACS